MKKHHAELSPAWAQCEGKERYITAPLANMVAKRRNRAKKVRSKAEFRWLEAYHCKHCGGYHIGGTS